jgi:hypothetical protein
LHFKFSFVLGVGKVISPPAPFNFFQQARVRFSFKLVNINTNWFQPFLSYLTTISCCFSTCVFWCCSVVSNQTSWWIIF